MILLVIPYQTKIISKESVSVFFVEFRNLLELIRQHLITITASSMGEDKFRIYQHLMKAVHLLGNHSTNSHANNYVRMFILARLCYF